MATQAELSSRKTSTVFRRSAVPQHLRGKAEEPRRRVCCHKLRFRWAL